MKAKHASDLPLALLALPPWRYVLPVDLREGLTFLNLVLIACFWEFLGLKSVCCFLWPNFTFNHQLPLLVSSSLLRLLLWTLAVAHSEKLYIYPCWRFQLEPVYQLVSATFAFQIEVGACLLFLHLFSPDILLTYARDLFDLRLLHDCVMILI